MDAETQVAEPASSPESDAESYAAFRSELFGAGLLFDTGVDGVYAKSSVYEGIVQALDRLITSSMVDQPAEVLSFPPVLARWVFDKTDYLKSFPDLMGSVHTFRGTDRQHAELISLAESGRRLAAVSRARRGRSLLGDLSSRLSALHRVIARGRPSLRGERLLLPLRAERRPHPDAGVPNARVRLRRRT